MKKNKILFLIVLVFQMLTVSGCGAQSFNLLKATRQGWAGGVAGHHGINYHIEIETASHKIHPDTVWINGKVYPLNSTFKDGRTVRTVDSVTHKVKYTISVGEAFNDFPLQPRRPGSDTAATKAKPVRQFNGVALISYMAGRKQHFFIIKSFTRLPQLNYP